MQEIPESEIWLDTPEMQERLIQAEEWMRDNPPAETNIDEFLAWMDMQRRSKDTQP